MFKFDSFLHIKLCSNKRGSSCYQTHGGNFINSADYQIFTDRSVSLRRNCWLI